MKDMLAALRTTDGTSAAIFFATVIITVTLFWWVGRDPPVRAKPEREQEPPRNFTLAQLKVRVCIVEGGCMRVHVDSGNLNDGLR